MWPRQIHRESQSGSGPNAWLDQRDTTMQRYRNSQMNHNENIIHHILDNSCVSSYDRRLHLSMNRESLDYDSREFHYCRVTEPPYFDRNSPLPRYTDGGAPRYTDGGAPRYTDGGAPRYADDRAPRYTNDSVPRFTNRESHYTDDSVPHFTDRESHYTDDRVPHYTNTSFSGTNQGGKRNILCYRSKPSENLEPQWSNSYSNSTEWSERIVTMARRTKKQTGAPGFGFCKYRRRMGGKNSSNENTLIYPSRKPSRFPNDCGSGNPKSAFSICVGTKDSNPSTSSKTTVFRTVYIQKDPLTGISDPELKTIPLSDATSSTAPSNNLPLSTLDISTAQECSRITSRPSALNNRTNPEAAPSQPVKVVTKEFFDNEGVAFQGQSSISAPTQRRYLPSDIVPIEQCDSPPSHSTPNGQHDNPLANSAPNVQHGDPPADSTSNEQLRNPPAQSTPNEQHDNPPANSAPNVQHGNPPTHSTPNEQHGNPSAHSALYEQHGNPSAHSAPNEQHGNPPANSTLNFQHGNPSAHSAPNEQHGDPPPHSALCEQHGHTAQKIKSVAEIEEWLKHRLKGISEANPTQELKTAQSGKNPCQLTAEQPPSSMVKDYPSCADIQSNSRCVIKEQHITAVTPVAVVSPLEPQRHAGPVGSRGRDDEHIKGIPKWQHGESTTGNDCGKSPVFAYSSPSAVMDRVDHCSQTDLCNELAKQEMTLKGQVNNRPQLSSNEEYCDIVVESVTERCDKSGTAVLGIAPVIHHTLTALRDLVHSLENTVNLLEHKDDTISSVIQNCWGGDFDKCKALNCKQFPQDMKDVTVCAKTKDYCSLIINYLLGMSVEELVAKYPKLSEKIDKEKSSWLKTNEKVDDMDKDPRLTLGLNSFPEEEITHIAAKQEEMEETINSLVNTYDLKTKECLPVPDRKELNVPAGIQADTETLSMKYSCSSSKESLFKVSMLSAEEAKKYFELAQKNASSLSELSAPFPKIQNNIAVTPSENKGQEKEPASRTETTAPYQEDPSPLFVKLEKPSQENTDRGCLEQTCCCPSMVVNDSGLESRNCPFCNKEFKINYIMSSMFTGLNSDPVQIPVSKVHSLSNDSVCLDPGNNEEVNDQPILVEPQCLKCLKYEDISDEEDPWHDEVTVDKGPIYEDVTPVEDTLSEDEGEDEDCFLVCITPACLTFEPVEVTPVKSLHLQSEQKDENTGNSANSCYGTSVLSPNLTHNEEEHLFDQTAASPSPHTKGIEYLPKLKNDQAIEGYMLITQSGTNGKQCKEQRHTLLRNGEPKSYNTIQRRANSIVGVEENANFSISPTKNSITMSRGIQEHSKKKKRARKRRRVQSDSESEDINSTPEKPKKIKFSTGTNHSKLTRAKDSKRVASEFESHTGSAHCSIREQYFPQKRQKFGSDKSIYEHKRRSSEEARYQCKKEALKALKDFRLVCEMETEDCSDDNVVAQDNSMDRKKKCNVPPVCTSSPSHALKRSAFSENTKESSDDFVVPQHHHVGKEGSCSSLIPPLFKPTKFQSNQLKPGVKSSCIIVSKRIKNVALEYTDVLPETPKVQTVTESSNPKGLIDSFNREMPNTSMVGKEALFSKLEINLKGEANGKEVRKETDKVKRKKQEKIKYYEYEKNGKEGMKTNEKGGGKVDKCEKVQRKRMRGEKCIDKIQSSKVKKDIAFSKYGDCNIKTDSDSKSRSHILKLDYAKTNIESTNIISLSPPKTSTMVTSRTSSKISSSNAYPFPSKTSPTSKHPSPKASASREPPSASKASAYREPPSVFKAPASIPSMRHDGTSARQYVNSHWAPGFFPTRRDRSLSSGLGQQASPQSSPDNIPILTHPLCRPPSERLPGNNRPKGRPGSTTSLMKRSMDQALMLSKSIHREIPKEPRPVGEGYKWADKRRPSQTKRDDER